MEPEQVIVISKTMVEKLANGERVMAENQRGIVTEVRVDGN